MSQKVSARDVIKCGCGGIAELRFSGDREVSWVRCPDCSLEGPLSYKEDEAIERWNSGERRVNLATSGASGYVTAFYELAKLLGIGARPAPPAQIWRQEMLPRLQEALTPTDWPVLAEEYRRERDKARAEVRDLLRLNAAYRQLAINEGWSNNLERAYGREEYAKQRHCYVDGRVRDWLEGGAFQRHHKDGL